MGPSGIGKSVSATASSMILVGFSIVAAWAAPSSTVEVPSNQIHMLHWHRSADCKEQLLSDTALLGELVVNV